MINLRRWFVWKDISLNMLSINAGLSWEVSIVLFRFKPYILIWLHLEDLVSIYFSILVFIPCKHNIQYVWKITYPLLFAFLLGIMGKKWNSVLISIGLCVNSLV